MRPFVPADHPEVAAWYAARGGPAPALDAFPVTGLVEPGVAYIGLVRTDTSAALIEGAISNPAAPAKVRSRAIRAITEGLTDEARRLGFLTVIVSTKDAGVRRFTERLAFRQVGNFAMMAKAL